MRNSTDSTLSAPSSASHHHHRLALFRTTSNISTTSSTSTSEAEASSSSHPSPSISSSLHPSSPSEHPLVPPNTPNTFPFGTSSIDEGRNTKYWDPYFGMEEARARVNRTERLLEFCETLTYNVTDAGVPKVEVTSEPAPPPVPNRPPSPPVSPLPSPGFHSSGGHRNPLREWKNKLHRDKSNGSKTSLILAQCAASRSSLSLPAVARSSFSLHPNSSRSSLNLPSSPSASSNEEPPPYSSA